MINDNLKSLALIAFAKNVEACLQLMVGVRKLDGVQAGAVLAT